MASRRLEWLVGQVIQATIPCILLVGVYTRSLGVIVNAVLALGATFLPAVPRRDWQIRLHPFLGLWLALAVSFYAVGVFSPYSYIGW